MLPNNITGRKERKEKLIEYATDKTGQRGKTNTKILMTSAEKTKFEKRLRKKASAALASGKNKIEIDIPDRAVTVDSTGNARYYKQKPPGVRKVTVGITPKGAVNHYYGISGKGKSLPTTKRKHTHFS